MEIIKMLANKFDADIHTLKVVEECMELSEVLVKSLTKAKEYKPPVEKIIEEMGDVIFRMKVLAEKLQIQTSVDARVLEKGIQMEEWLKSKYL